MKKIRFYTLPLFIVLFFGLAYPLDSNTVMAKDIKGYTLKELLALAIEKNPSVAVFRANLNISRGEVISSTAYPNPEIGFEIGKGTSLEGPDSKREYSINISQSFEWPKKRFFRKKATEAALQVSRYENEGFILGLRYEVKVAFYRFLLNKREVEIASENMETVNELFNTVKIRVEAGETPEFELIKAQVEALKVGKELRKAENRVAIARTVLNSLLGNALPDGFDIQGEFLVPANKYNTDELLSIALEKHPLILRQKKEFEARGYALEREKESVFPDVTVNGAYDRELNKESYTVGLSIPLPLWYQKKGEITTARAEKTKAKAKLHEISFELSALLEEAYRNYRIALDRINVFEKGLLGQAEEALHIAEFSYSQGESGLLDYLDAQRVYRETLLDYNRARFELSYYIVEIERLEGREQM